NAANWVEAADSPFLAGPYGGHNPVSANTHQGCIFWGNDAQGMGPIILRHDTSNDSFSRVLEWPKYNDDCNSPYLTNGPMGNVFGQTTCNGVMYAAVEKESGNVRVHGGIYVSVDGINWICAWRVNDSHQGFWSVEKASGGYLWGVYETIVSKYLYRMTPVSAETVRALLLERGVANLYTADTSSFEISDGGVTLGTDPAGEICRSNEKSLHGDYSLKFAGLSNSNSLTVLNIPQVGPIYSGDYFVFSFWIKTGPGWPDEYRLNANVLPDHCAIVSSEAVFQPDSNWQTVRIWGKCTEDQGDDTGALCASITVDDNGYTGDKTKAVFYIDCIQMVCSSSFHDLTSWQFGDTPRADEYAIMPLNDMASNFTTTFVW
ncbi:unnamed protein product, partial [marine sediment metagenome]